LYRIRSVPHAQTNGSSSLSRLGTPDATFAPSARADFALIRKPQEHDGRLTQPRYGLGNANPQ
jgi:hypothetical protein